MTAETLIQVLEKACSDAGLDPSEVEVRLAMQPTWPMEYTIDEYPDIQVIGIGDDVKQQIIHLPEGHQTGYLPGEVSESLGWR